MNKIFRLGELFSGAGGMALGSQNAKQQGITFEHVWANDMDKDACETFRKNIHIDSNHVFCSNVQDLKFENLESIDGLVFGFPCNDFSIVGSRSGINGEYGKLYQWGEKALKYFQPSFFVAENVSGLASSGKRSDFEFILTKLQKAGYNIYPSLYRFEQYGVPQSRHRIIIVGFRSDLNIIDFKHPIPTHEDAPITAKIALQDVPSDALNHEYTKHPPNVIERLQHIMRGQNAFTANLPDALQLRMKSGATISQIYRRLSPDKPSYTVTGSGGGGTHLYHWDEPRALTNRERAQLQSFPDSFLFYGGKESVRKQIGMAVPPIGAEIVFNAVLKT